jgi:hypothetical protein
MKTYNFILSPSSPYHNFDLRINIFSSRKVTLAGAWRWAGILAKFNPDCDTVLFRSVNGRKTYRLVNALPKGAK